MLKKLPTPSNAVMLKCLYGKTTKSQPSIAGIDNMSDIRRISTHYKMVFIAFSHLRLHSTLSVTTTVALQQSSVTAPAVLP